MTDAQMGRWYMVDKIGMATLCSNRADAEQEAKDATLCYPHMAPHCAVLLAPGACELKTTNATVQAAGEGFISPVAPATTG